MSDAAQKLEGEGQQATFNQLAAVPLPQVVFNAFAHNVTQSEITIIVSFGPRPLAMLTMAPTMAKTLGEALLAMVAEYQTATGQSVKSIQDMQREGIKNG